MKISAKIKYYEKYQPTKRHRIPRLREKKEIIEVELREIKKENLRLALVVTDYKSYIDEKGVNRFGPVNIEYYAIDQKLFVQKRDTHGALDRGEYSLKSLIEHIEGYEKWGGWHSNDSELTRDVVTQDLQEFLNSHIVIAGKVYVESPEPRYVVNTFGLGHNHGGTCMFIEHFYNENISKNNYFNALQREEAISYANAVAKRRGDSNDVGRFGEVRNIQVLMPEIIRCNPQKEHGEGNPFLNSIEDMVQSSNSSLEAGLLVMTSIPGETQEQQKSSLNQKIVEAQKRNNTSLKDDNLHENHRNHR